MALLLSGGIEIENQVYPCLKAFFWLIFSPRNVYRRWKNDLASLMVILMFLKLNILDIVKHDSN